MHTRPLGTTTLRVSELGFGAAPLGDEYGAIDPRAGERAVALAVESGINFFDVAPYYGRTLAEERLGQWLEGRRDRVVLSTKVGRYDRDLPDGFDFSAARVARSIEESLRRLRTDVIDLCIAHDIEFGRREDILFETLPALRALQLQGKIRYVGISGFPLEHLRDVADAASVDVILSYCHYDLLNTRLQTVLIPFAVRRGIGLINASPLHMGVLTRRGPPAWHPAPPHVLQAGRAAAEFCAARGVDIAQVALSFALSADGVATTLVGMRSEEEVRATLRALDAEPDPELTQSVRALLADVQDVEWPVGLPENNRAVAAYV